MKGTKDGKSYTVLSTAVQDSKVERDLEDLIDSSLNFGEHVARLTTKANQVVGVIPHSFDYLDKDIFVQLYKSLVRPIVENGHSAWQLFHKTLCADIEDVQRLCTKLLSLIRDLPYSERLEALNLPCLEHTCLRVDLIDTYNYMHGLHRVLKLNFQLSSNRDTRGHSFKLASAWKVEGVMCTLEFFWR
jgi:hypothetical protein